MRKVWMFNILFALAGQLFKGDSSKDVNFDTVLFGMK